jgi:hypothetical protein
LGLASPGLLRVGRNNRDGGTMAAGVMLVGPTKATTQIGWQRGWDNCDD